MSIRSVHYIYLLSKSSLHWTLSAATNTHTQLEYLQEWILHEGYYLVLTTDGLTTFELPSSTFLSLAMNLAILGLEAACWLHWLIERHVCSTIFATASSSDVLREAISVNWRSQARRTQCPLTSVRFRSSFGSWTTGTTVPVQSQHDWWAVAKRELSANHNALGITVNIEKSQKPFLFRTYTDSISPLKKLLITQMK